MDWVAFNIFLMNSIPSNEFENFYHDSIAIAITVWECKIINSIAVFQDRDIEKKNFIYFDTENVPWMTNWYTPDLGAVKTPLVTSKPLPKFKRKSLNLMTFKSHKTILLLVALA